MEPEVYAKNPVILHVSKLNGEKKTADMERDDILRFGWLWLTLKYPVSLVDLAVKYERKSPCSLVY